METSFVPQWIIEKKRDGFVLPEADIREFIARYNDGRIPDYQMAALAMAILLRGMNADETLALTDAMMRSGSALSWEMLDRPSADKHSTGGIGDKISIPLAPLVASCGVAVPMISGRGLGITGGTLDKLDSIPGYATNVSTEKFRAIVSEVGCSIIGQTEDLAPADRKLYALRDVTGTVPSIELITASILSKKLAEGAKTLVFDVKCGTGAFMKTREDAQKLADSLVRVARNAGRNAEALITPMSEPLGCTAGNALEIEESVEILKNAGPADVRGITLSLAVPMLLHSGITATEAEARIMLEEKLSSGAALEQFARMVSAHGGNPALIDNPAAVLPQAPVQLEVCAPEGGIVSKVDAETLGRVVLLLGGGRRTVTDSIDYSAGISRLVKTGAKVSRGDVLLRLHAATREAAETCAKEALNAFSFI